MLAPYYAGIDAYDPRKDFLKVSKDCVLGHEDADAMPQLWTLWMYGAGGMDLFPESRTTAGVQEPVCSGTGVAWWLLKHLKEFPVLNYDGKATEAVKVDVKKGKTVKKVLKKLKSKKTYFVRIRAYKIVDGKKKFGPWSKKKKVIVQVREKDFHLI